MSFEADSGCQINRESSIAVVLSLCLAQSALDGNAERSIQDSGYSRTAQQIMRTAMKLPPHILPTLDELDTPPGAKRDKSIGVYVPELGQPVGVYMPRVVQAEEELPRKKRRIKQRPFRPHKGHLNSVPPVQRPKPYFTVPIPPNSPLGKLYTMGTSKWKVNTKKLLANIKNNIKVPKPRPNPHLNLAAPVRQRKKDRPTRKRPVRHKKKANNQRLLHTNAEEPSFTRHPYQFEKANFELNWDTKEADHPEEPNGLDLKKNTRRPPDEGPEKRIPSRRKRPQQQLSKDGLANNVHQYVPTFVKEVLAKSLLKKPNKYLERLHSQQEKKAKKRRKQPIFYINNQRPQQPVTTPKPLAFDETFPWGNSHLQRLPEFAQKQQQRLPEFAQNQPEFGQKPPEFAQNQPGFAQNQPGFAQNQPGFAQNQHALPEFNQPDNRFFHQLESLESKSTEVDDDTEEIPVHRTQDTVFNRQTGKTVTTNTLCFCCEDEDYYGQPGPGSGPVSVSPDRNGPGAFINVDFEGYNKRKKRTVRLQDPGYSRHVMQHHQLIKKSLACENQDPIEVVLVMDSESSQKARSTTTEVPFIYQHPTWESHKDYYDPTKLNFIFSTPSPLSRKFIEIRDSEAVLSADEQPVDYQVEKATVQQPTLATADNNNNDLPVVVNTLPGYNILRLLTG